MQKKTPDYDNVFKTMKSKHKRLSVVPYEKLCLHPLPTFVKGWEVHLDILS